MVNNFNEYSKEQDLDIHLEMILFSDHNVTYKLDNYGETIESLLLKKSMKYDIFCFDPLYNNIYDPHLEDIKNLLKKYDMENHLNLYNKGEALKTCKVNDKWVALVNIFSFYYS